MPGSAHRVLGENHSARIETLVHDMIETSARLDDIQMSQPVWDAMMELRAFLFQNVYTAEPVMQEVRKAKHLVEDLFDYFVRHYDQVPAEVRAISDGDPLRAVTDHVAGMTDRYATNFFKNMFVPQSFR